MNNTTDQTNFWLAWHATCAAVSCTERPALEKACAADVDRYGSVLSNLDETQKLAREIIASTNFSFRKAMDYLRKRMGNRNSDLIDEMSGWLDGSPGNGCAFMLLEGQLYANETIKGRPFKDYLFEDIATRAGGIGANLFGYVKAMLFDVAKKSFCKTLHYEPKVGDDGKPIDDVNLSTDKSDGFMDILPSDQAEVSDVSEFFGHYVDERGSPRGGKSPEWTRDNWIALYCALHQIPVSTADVASLCCHKKSAVALISKKTLGELLLSLRRRPFSDKSIARAIQSRIPDILDEKMKGMPFYADLERIRVGRIKNGAGVENA